MYKKAGLIIYFLVAQTVKRLPTMRETWVWSLSWEDPLEKAMASHSSTLAWKIPWMEEPGRLQSMGSLRVRHDWMTSLSLFTFMHWRRKWQPTPVFLPGESQGRGSLVGGRLWDHTELDTTEQLHFHFHQPTQNLIFLNTWTKVTESSYSGYFQDPTGHWFETIQKWIKSTLEFLWNS